MRLVGRRRRERTAHGGGRNDRRSRDGTGRSAPRFQAGVERGSISECERYRPVECDFLALDSILRARYELFIRFSQLLFDFPLNYSLPCFVLLCLLLPCQIWVGVLLITQPFYVGGFKDNAAVESGKASAFGAATAFFFTFVASIVIVIRDGRRYSQSGVLVEEGPRRLQNPFSDRAGTGGSIFHDYDPVDTGTPEEFERGVFS